ncbi:MAG TPA: trigger factor [Geminicoccaceae bacterium]|jgi:trigger factor|nr:trigger factor [Geminicoccaceae bacterium]
MQVTELSAEGLKREYKVIVQATEIEDRIAGRLEELKGRIRMPGFRPGKVPLALLRKQYGRSVRGEVLEQAVNQGSQKAIADHELRPALRPKIEVTSFDEGADLEFTMALEVLPEVPEVDLKKIELVRPVAEVDDDAVNKALDNFAKRFQEYEPPAEARPARPGDRLLIDFEGRIEGEVFEGGKAEDFPLVLGSGFMVPGFEDQLMGAEPGVEVTVNVDFPDAFPNPALAGKPATFAVTVKQVEEPKPVVLDDDLAKGQGFDDLAALKATIRESITREYAQVSRARVKRALLDELAEHNRFEVPLGMVELEFEAIWKQLKDEMERTGEPFPDGRSEDEVKQEYRSIAERRVRLGLLLSDIGQKNELKVEQHELNNAIMAQARRYPGQEQKVIDFFRNNPQAVEQLRAPLYEDKVVDFILQMANVSERKVTPEELFADPDADEAAGASESSEAAAT